MAELWDILDKNGNKTGYLHECGNNLSVDKYFLTVNDSITSALGEAKEEIGVDLNSDNAEFF